MEGDWIHIGPCCISYWLYPWPLQPIHLYMSHFKQNLENSCELVNVFGEWNVLEKSTLQMVEFHMLISKHAFIGLIWLMDAKYQF